MVYRFLGFTLDARRFELRHNGRLVKLEPRVLDLLLYLVINRDRVVSKSELFEVLWLGRKVSEASLSVAIAAIRRATRDADKEAHLIETQHARGYRFVAPAEEVSTLERGGTGNQFVGRERELAILGDLLAAAEDGSTQTCLVSGEPGIGKSRLAGEIALRAARRRFISVTARCLEEDGSVPFWPWIQALRHILEAVNGRPTWPESVIGEIARLLPELSERNSTHSPNDPGTASGRLRLFDAVTYVVRSVSKVRPLLLIFDDVHRADQASLLLLEFVVQQTPDCRLMIMMADRDAETRRSEMHRERIGSICRIASASTILLRGLSAEEIALLVSHRVAEASRRAAAAAVLRDLTDGNPFFVTQLIALPGVWDAADSGALVQSLPHSVRETVALQLAGVGLAARKVLMFAAVLGRAFELPVLAALSGDRREAEEAVDAALASRLIQAVDVNRSLCRFSHVIVRDVLYDALPTAERAEAHWNAAHAIERASSGRSLETVAEIAFHRYRGVSVGDGLVALQSVRLAGMQASQRLAFEDAVVQYERAIELAEVYAPLDLAGRCDLYIALGIERSRASDREAGRRSLAIAGNLARELKDGVRLASVALASFPGFFAVEAGAPDPVAIGLMREALASLGPDRPDLRALLLGRLAMALAWLENGRDREVLCAEACQLSESIGAPEIAIQTLLARWFAEWEPSGFEDRWAIADRLMEKARVYGDPETLLLCRLFWVTSLLERGQMGEFTRQILVFEDAAEKLRQPEALWYAALLRAVHALHEGRLHDAQLGLERFVELGTLLQDANVFHSRMSHSFVLAWELGRWEELLEIATRGAETFPGVVGWRAARAWALALAGDFEECGRSFEALAAHDFQDIPRRMDWPLTIAFLSEVAIALGDRKRAAALFEMLAPLRGRLIVVGVSMLTWGSTSRLLGALARLLGSEESESHLREAVAIEGEVGARAWQVRSRLELARLLMAEGRSSHEHAEAKTHLELARAAAGSLGLIALAREIDRTESVRVRLASPSR